jgi:hypothetical protein
VFPGLTVLTDVSPAQWLLDRLWPRGAGDGPMRVGCLVPEGYPAYGRLLHPARSTEPDGPDRWRWSDIAAVRQRRMDPEIRFNELVGWEGTADPPWPYQAPDDGSLDETACHALTEILPAFTTRPRSCWFCLWDGYGWPELPAHGEGPPRVPLAYGIDCLLLHGPVTAACNFRSGPWFQSPTAWWPDDRAWCVATDVDGYSTYIAGTQECIDALARDPRLEIVPAQPSQAVDPSPYPPRR